MKRNILIPSLVAVFCVSSLLGQPTVTPFSVEQIDGTKQVRIVYNLSHGSGLNSTVSVSASQDGGSTFLSLSELSGAVESGISPGNNKQIIWQAGAGGLWSDAEQYAGGWLYYDWFGWFVDIGSNWITHAEHGYQYCIGKDTNSIFLYDFGMGCWLWTSVDLYPYLYKFGENAGWYLYTPGGSSGNRWFWRAKDGEWIDETSINEPIDPGPAPAGFSLIPAGSFSMGDSFGEGDSDELPVHDVYVSAFYMQQTEVTNGQVAEVLNWAIGQGLASATSSTVQNLEGNEQELLDLDSRYCQITLSGGQLVVDSGKEDYPCLEVTWYGAMAYCHYLTRMEGGLSQAVDLSDWSINTTATGYRLPTEAEWEKAARGGQNGWRYPFGNEISSSVARYSSRSTVEVASYPATGYDLYDMAGNVWEWCYDWFDLGYYSGSPGSDPEGPSSGTNRVVRGGSWNDGANDCRVANRNRNNPPYSYYYIGFRPVRSQ